MADEEQYSKSLSRVEVRSRVDSLSKQQTVELSEQTREVLDAHGDIQREHRDQAKWFLRAYVTGTGILIAALAWAIDTLRGMFPAVNDVQTVWVVVPAPFVVGLGIYLLFRGFIRFIGTLELVTTVLSPKNFDNNSLPLRILRNLIWYKEAIPDDRTDEKSTNTKETIERVIEGERLANVIKDGPRKQNRVLTDRICRIVRNEQSINKNMRRLTLVYRITAASFGDAVLGVAVVGVIKFFILPA